MTWKTTPTIKGQKPKQPEDAPDNRIAADVNKKNGGKDSSNNGYEQEKQLKRARATASK